MTHIMRLPTHSDRIEELASDFYRKFCNLTNSYFLSRQMYIQLLMVAFIAKQQICAWFSQPSESLLSKPSPQLTRGESSWSDSAYVSKVKPSTCTHMCIVVICLQNSLRFKNKQLIELSALSALSQSLSTSRSKKHKLSFSLLDVFKTGYFSIFCCPFITSWVALAAERTRGRSTIIWAWKAITDWEAITDWTRHWQQIWGTA